MLGGKPFRGRVLASAVALGTGNMLGLEGPAIYLKSLGRRNRATPPAPPVRAHRPSAAARRRCSRRCRRRSPRTGHRRHLRHRVALSRGPGPQFLAVGPDRRADRLRHRSRCSSATSHCFPVEGATDVMVPQLWYRPARRGRRGSVARWGASALALAKRLHPRRPRLEASRLAGTVISATSVAVRLAADTPGVLGPATGWSTGRSRTTGRSGRWSSS